MRHRPRPLARRSPAVLVFGESRNDSESVRRLLVGLEPGLDGFLQVTLRPTSLTRDAGPTATTSWVQKLQGAVAVAQHLQPVAAVVVHRDADGLDPHGRQFRQLTDALQPCHRETHIVLPVQMTEAWWFLFPDAVEAVRPQAWRKVMPRVPRDVELIAKPKAELRRLTKRTGTIYSEADSPAIAEEVARQRLSPLGSSVSYDRLPPLARKLVGLTSGTR